MDRLEAAWLVHAPHESRQFSGRIYLRSKVESLAVQNSCVCFNFQVRVFNKLGAYLWWNCDGRQWSKSLSLQEWRPVLHPVTETQTNYKLHVSKRNSLNASLWNQRNPTSKYLETDWYSEIQVSIVSKWHCVKTVRGNPQIVRKDPDESVPKYVVGFPCPFHNFRVRFQVWFETDPAKAR